jgi:hypothetical protein
MKYFFLEPEVAGELGSNTVMDRITWPPTVRKLHYEFDTWLGDVLLEGFACWIVTVDAMTRIKQLQLTGVKFSDVQVTKSEAFDEWYPGRELPAFAWLQVPGTAGRDDFGSATRINAGSTSLFPDDAQFRGTLVVSERALELLRRLGIEHAAVWDFIEPPKSDQQEER